MTWQDRMYAGLGEYLRSIGKDAITVTNISEDASSTWGGCETCGYGEQGGDFETTIKYTDSKGKPQSYYYSSSLSDLIKSIT
jgi:hypothetical protein